MALASIIILLSRPDEDDEGIDVHDSNEEKVPEQKPPLVIKKQRERS